MAEKVDTAPTTDPPPQYPGVPTAAPQIAYSTFPQQPPQTTIVQTGLPPQPVFRAGPVHLRCPLCQADTVTTLSYEIGLFTWSVVGIICLFGGVFGCCLIPFCIEGCKDVNHNCGNCHRRIGAYNRF